MSYILEALRKSDQQRQQGAAPTLMSVQLPVEEAPPRAFSWALALALAVFIAGILIGWRQPWKVEQSAVAVRQTEAKPVDQGPAVDSPPGIAPARPSAVPAARPLPAPLPAPVQARQAPANQVVPPAVKDHSPSAAAPVKPAGVVEPNVMAKAELPPAILQELPGMSVSLHAYSAKTANRLVSINNRFLQEGDSLIPGLVLEQITPKDMIFSYKGYRFRQGVQ